MFYGTTVEFKLTRCYEDAVGQQDNLAEFTEDTGNIGQQGAKFDCNNQVIP